jgi:phenylacetate-coenzyme A ligase PaaK-like adenylate-forming protein
MNQSKKLEEKIFHIQSVSDFNELALEIFQFQYKNVKIYHEFVCHLGINGSQIDHWKNIPFLPISFFKTHKVLSAGLKEETIFTSSGTAGAETSSHFVADLSLYEKSFLQGFKCFYGKPSNYRVMALLPSYLERKGSSLVYMADKLIQLSKDEQSGFYLSNLEELVQTLKNPTSKPILLFWVSFALLDLVQYEIPEVSNLIVMETGGMKGRRQEIIKEEFHKMLKIGFKVNSIHSEYGMTELLSQAYSDGQGLFKTPPWMKILIRDINDPLTSLGNGKSGGINIIDLANLYSCSFIATSDLGKKTDEDTFEVLGRFDHSDIRGCNLMYD